MSVSLEDRVDSLDPSLLASKLGDDERTSLSRVTDDRDDRSDKDVDAVFSLVLPVSHESQYMSEVLSL